MRAAERLPLDVEGQLPPKQLDLRRTKPSKACVLCCLAVCLGGGLHGYFNGVAGGVSANTAFLKTFYPEVLSQPHASSLFCQQQSQRLQLFSSSHFVAAAALEGSGLPATLNRRLGRVTLLSIAGGLFGTGALLQGAAVNIAMLVLGRVIAGAGLSFALVSALLYVSEVAPTRVRGTLLNIFQVMLAGGICLAGLANLAMSFAPGAVGWRLPLLLPTPLAMTLVLVGRFIPDSPASLMERGKSERARAALTRLHRGGPVQHQLDRLEQESSLARCCLKPWRQLVRPSHRPQLVLSCCSTLLQQLTGINFVVFYGPQLFSVLGFSRVVASVIELVLVAVLFGASLVTVALVDRVGRRPLLMIGSAGACVCMASIGTLLSVVHGQPTWLSWAVFPMACSFMLFYGISWGPLGWTYPAEIQDLPTRSAGLSLTAFCNVALSAVAAQAILPTACALRQGLFFGFALFSALAGLTVWAIFPETNQQPNVAFGAIRVWRVLGAW